MGAAHSVAAVNLYLSGISAQALAAHNSPKHLKRIFEMDEARRRMLLAAMHIEVWLPREPLPYAAPSRESVLNAPNVPWFPEPMAAASTASTPNTTAVAAAATPITAVPSGERRLSVLPQPLPSGLPKRVSANSPAVSVLPPVVQEAPPRFTLQLWQSGSALLLLDVSDAPPFSTRAPAYYLLSDMLRAVGLPDKPQSVTEPILWPLLRGQNIAINQGNTAACRYVNTVLRAQQTALGSTVLWLVGEAAARFSHLTPHEASAEFAFEQAPFGTIVRLPSLHALMETPALKREVWHRLRPLIPRWISQ